MSEIIWTHGTDVALALLTLNFNVPSYYLESLKLNENENEGSSNEIRETKHNNV